MKTAISIPDPLFKEAEAMAETLGMSRSELYTTALHDYIKQRRKTYITEQYNRVYAEESSEIDPVLMQMQLQSLPKEEWR